MSDLEDRLTTALRQGAADAPSASGLADGARRRARARRRHRYEAVGLAAVLALGVPVALTSLHLHRADTPQATVASPPPWVTEPAPVGYRWESWHGVSVQVPDSWGFGTLTSWCAGGQNPTPRVQRPDDVGEDIACTPSESYGLRFSEAPGPGLNWPVAPQYNDAHPSGAMVGTRDVGGVFVEVATPSAALSQRLLDSVRLTADVRPDSCPARASQEPAAVTDGEVAVCGYDADGMLSRSELLVGADATRVTTALQAGVPAGSYEGCTGGGPQAATVRVATTDSWRVVDPRLGNCLLAGQ